MLLGRYYEGMELHREDKIIYGRLLVPHLAVSTCRAGGGLRGDLEFLGNHQSCEPAGDSHALIAAVEPEAYHESACLARSIPPDRCALLGTAANMRLAGVEALSFRDLTVVAAVTGGVEGNAGRAGDPAYGWEGPEGYETLPRGPSEAAAPAGEPPPGRGTINTLLFISQPLTPGALVRTIITATEAKTAVLEELSVNSRYSAFPATGTGTDQIGAAAKTCPGRRPITSSGKHSKLGEMIARAVSAALKDALARQNGMTPERQRSVRIHLERFGLRPDGRAGLETGQLIDLIALHLGEAAEALMRANCRGLLHDPMNVAQVAAMAHVRDKFSWGILPWSVHAEVMARQAALLAVEAAGRPDLYPK
jgi:adenosylcobinamide amidohydrolase